MPRAMPRRPPRGGTSWRCAIRRGAGALVVRAPAAARCCPRRRGACTNAPRRTGTAARRRPERDAEATPERWWDCNNIRFRGGQLQPIGGNVAQPGTAVADLPRDLLTWHDNATCAGRRSAPIPSSMRTASTLQRCYDITPAGVGPLDPPGALVGYGLGGLRRGALRHRARSRRHRPAGHRRHHGRPVVRWTRSARIC